MGSLCKYWPVFLEFLKKEAHKIFLAGFMEEKIGPRGRWAWEPSGDQDTGPAPGHRPGVPKSMDFEGKSMILAKMVEFVAYWAVPEGYMVVLVGCRVGI